MRLRNSLPIGALILVLASCIQEDHFGLSPYGYIKGLQVQNQASQSRISVDSLTVFVDLPPGIDASACLIHEISLSSFASADKGVGDVLDLRDTQEILVVAEDGTDYTWKIVPQVASANPQLPHGDMNTWYETPGGFYEPGEELESTIWGTGNAGTQILGLLATTPIEFEAGNRAALMETLYNGKLAETFGTPISAGSLFTGKFDSDKIDPSDPEAAINFGTAFSSRPMKISFSYSYQPGEENKDRDGNVLPEGDQCDIYALLEVRSLQNSQRLATAWFRSGEAVTELETVVLDFIYGELDGSYPDYMKPKDGEYVSKDSLSFILPTHLTFVASSSYLGAEFSGAVGSRLVIDNIELIYED